MERRGDRVDGRNRMFEALTFFPDDIIIYRGECAALSCFWPYMEIIFTDESVPFVYPFSNMKEDRSSHSSCIVGNVLDWLVELRQTY